MFSIVGNYSYQVNIHNNNKLNTSPSVEETKLISIQLWNKKLNRDQISLNNLYSLSS